MALRLGGLADLDPLKAPLPVGTEVVTRVDRTVGEEIRPQGVAGRVSRIDGARVEVTFVDGVVALYGRDELVPRKRGGHRFAVRREAAWEALRPCVVVDTIVGSRAWGVAHEGSDTDRRGIFVLPFPWTVGLADPPLDLVSLDGSETYWEVGKAVRQALRADPNTLEMLFADPVVVDPMGASLVAMREGFLSQEIYGAFGRYAIAQLDRLEHHIRLHQHRAWVASWLRAEPSLTLDAAAARLARETDHGSPTPAESVARARESLRQLHRSLFDQGLIPANDFAALRHAASTDLPLPRDLRPKNAYNLIRLLDLAIRWLSGESPEVRVSEALRPTLVAIKHGDVPMTEVMALARTMTPRLEQARSESPLPRHPDVTRAESVLRAIRVEAARRHLEPSSNAWGIHAPEPPEVCLV